MPTGRVKWFDAEKGFGFLTQDDGGKDVFVHRDSLADGLQEIVKGQKVEFSIIDTRKGAQAMGVHVLEQSPLKPAELQPKHTPEELNSMLQDMVGVLETQVMPTLARGRRPDKKVSAKIAEVLRAVAHELD
ncbi:cold-shock protein [Haloglycomyces albus]|uniref:cold-shock protein n=1 Tax=Haloglycomyces albus TaxID=526067 RepID=UPI0006858727|nr:cold shock domain-containing protein [Haloglycomyces albus]